MSGEEERLREEVALLRGVVRGLLRVLVQVGADGPEVRGRMEEAAGLVGEKLREPGR